MRHHHYLLATLFALAGPSLASASPVPPPSPPPAAPEQAPTKGMAPTHESTSALIPEKYAMVRGYVLPTLAAIDSANVTTNALQKLVSVMHVMRRDSRETAELVQTVLTFAYSRAKQLAGMKELSKEAQMDAKEAVTKLEAADKTLASMIKGIGRAGGTLTSTDANKIDTMAMALHQDLTAARTSTEKVAQMYAIPTDLTTPAPGSKAGTT